MQTREDDFVLTRRRALMLGATAACGAMAAGLGASKAEAESGGEAHDAHDADVTFAPPPEATQKAIEQILEAEGSVSNGVFDVGLDRDDMDDVKRGDVPIKPSFEVSGDLYFQQNADGTVAMNGDFPLKAAEIDPFIRALISHGIVFQAEHQHFYDFSPVVWFVHFRAAGDALQIARGVKAALRVTSIPFPQKKSKNTTTPLPAAQLGEILGAKPSVGGDGVVSFNIPRAEPIRLGGMRVSPFLNESTTVKFQPHGGGQNAAAVPDFAMTASEVNPVVGLMQKQGWDIGCLYNQETDEFPQLYFSHQFKTGHAVALAKEIRAGLELTNVRLKA